MTTAKPAKKTAKKTAKEACQQVTCEERKRPLRLFAAGATDSCSFADEREKTALRKAAPSYVPLAQWCLGLLPERISVVLASRKAAGKVRRSAEQPSQDGSMRPAALARAEAAARVRPSGTASGHP